MRPQLELRLLLLLLFSAGHLLLGRVQAAAVASQDCGETFQSQLQQLLTTKQSCGSAAFYDCCQVKDLLLRAPTGEYVLRKFSGQSQDPFSPTVVYTVKARCDMDTDGGGWMVIQRRVAGGTVNFTRDWQSYEDGFGDLSEEFWYGLKNLHLLTARDDVELRIDMVKTTGASFSWTYQNFIVAGVGDKYRLTIGEGQGMGTDAMAYSNGMQFSTYDQDNDRSSGNCAYGNQAGWWYKSCYHTNFNGPHNTPSWAGVDQRFAKIHWKDGNTFHELSSVEMKIRVKTSVQEC